MLFFFEPIFQAIIYQLQTHRRKLQNETVLLSLKVKNKATLSRLIIHQNPEALTATMLRRTLCGPWNHLTSRQPPDRRCSLCFERRVSIVSYTPVICHHLIATSKPIVWIAELQKTVITNIRTDVSFLFYSLHASVVLFL